jgi:hypothetical protein
MSQPTEGIPEAGGKAGLAAGEKKTAAYVRLI